jgi:CYTH domain-containing protein
MEKRIVIDGGPCSGKTTGLIKISEKMIEQGILPFSVPEAATLLISSGITPKLVGIERFQQEVIGLQLRNEDHWNRTARKISGEQALPYVIFYDRGLLTGSAYLQGENQLENFQKKILAKAGDDYNIEEFRARYEGVIHMVTAADGAEKYYTLENNRARTETPGQARALDLRTQHAWLGHPHLAVIANKDKNGKRISFDSKIKNALAEVYRIIGLPIPMELEDKFELNSFDPAKLPVKFEMIDITQTYLIPQEEGNQDRVRMRSWMGFSSYFKTSKGPATDEGRPEIEHRISRKRYLALLENKKPETSAIRKLRYCFLWKNQYFEVDVFQGKQSNLILMERERTDKNDLTELPPFIDVKKEVTGEKAYSNFELAHS